MYVKEKTEKKTSKENIDAYSPFEDPVFMNKRMKTYFRAKLKNEEKKVCLLINRQVEKIREKTDQSSGLEDMAADEAEKRKGFIALDQNRKILDQIRKALDRLNRGEYGFCLKTGKRIPIKRLDAIPVAVYNVEEQEKIDSLEKSCTDTEEDEL